MRPAKSILLITVDSLRADHTGFQGYSRPTTPFLDSLSAESVVFHNALVAGAPTYYSFPAILASRYPLALGRDVLGLAPGEPTLASALKDAGYATAAFSAGNPYLSARFGYDHGFDRFEDFLQTPTASPAPQPAAPRFSTSVNRAIQRAASFSTPTQALYNELYFQYCQRRVASQPSSYDQLRRFPAADVLVEQARAWLASLGDRPFFLWLHFMDPHSPYYPAEPALQLMGDSISSTEARYLNSFWLRSDLSAPGLLKHLAKITALYDAGIRWVDTQVSHLIGGLRRDQRWQDCVFAFTADHGEEFLDHGGRYHPPNRLSEELLRVPLLIRAPGLSSNSTQRSPFSLLHLAPTLLDAAGLSAPAAFQGRSHWALLQRAEDWNAPAIAESVAGCTNPFHPENRFGARVLAVREGRYKLCLSLHSPLVADLFDLEADPAERLPLPTGEAREPRRRLLQLALAHVVQSRVQRDSRAQLAARLRDLQLEWANPDPVLQTTGL